MRVLVSCIAVLIISVLGCEKQEVQVQRSSPLAISSRVDTASLATKVEDTSAWMVRTYVDEFGDPTDSRYMTTKSVIKGVFSNSATQDSPLHVSLLIGSSSDICIELFEYAGNNPVKAYSIDEYWIIVKQDDGSKFTLAAKNFSNRLHISNTGDLNAGDAGKKLHVAFVRNRLLRFYIFEKNNRITNYTFEVDGTGYTAAYRQLMR